MQYRTTISTKPICLKIKEKTWNIIWKSLCLFFFWELIIIRLLLYLFLLIFHERLISLLFKQFSFRRLINFSSLLPWLISFRHWIFSIFYTFVFLYPFIWKISSLFVCVSFNCAVSKPYISFDLIIAWYTRILNFVGLSPCSQKRSSLFKVAEHLAIL